jgi:hypothetical protein
MKNNFFYKKKYLLPHSAHSKPANSSQTVEEIASYIRCLDSSPFSIGFVFFKRKNKLILKKS